MQIGIFAKTFAAEGALASLSAVRDAGYAVAQFNLAVLGGSSMPQTIEPATCAEIVAASAKAGVGIAAVSGTYNMIHRDKAQRDDGFARLAALIHAAPLMGIRLVTLCTGTRHATDQWAHHPDNAGAEAWRDLLVEMQRAVIVAETSGVDLGIEPELANVIASAPLARRLIDELTSPRLKIVLDPANLFETAPTAARQAIIAEAVDLLADRIVMAHAKDRGADGSFVAAGSGVIDFPHFVRTLRAAGFDGPLVTHGLSEAEAPKVAAFLHRVVADEGGA
jgi:sugar phosphate isomerase/epimerase